MDLYDAFYRGGRLQPQSDGINLVPAKVKSLQDVVRFEAHQFRPLRKRQGDGFASDAKPELEG